MRIYPQLLVDQEFKSLGDQGFMGTLNDRQFAFLRSKGYVNALPDMMTSWLSYSPANLFALNEPGIWLDPSDVANLDWRRNLLTYTEQFNSTAWPGFNGWSATSATTVTTTSATSSTRLNVSGLTSGQTYVLSVDLRKVSGAITSLVFDIGDGATQSVTLPTGSLSRVSTTLVAGSGAFLDIRSNDAGSFEITRIQLELGSVATDYQRITDVNTEVLERFPKTTMFQDRAGSTAVTTPGQSVGLRLDKSKGLVLGSELVTNGDFSGGGTDWTFAGAAPLGTVSGGAATFVGGAAGNRFLSQANRVVVGRTYAVTATVTVTAGDVGPDMTGTNVRVSTSGTYTWRLVASITAVSFIANSAFAGTIDNISVKELPGNHAVANSDAARGIYGIEPVGGRRNLLTFTEQFDNAAWTKTRSSVSANTSVAPDGTTTADKLVEDTTASNTHQIAGPIITLASASTNTVTVYVKAAERTWCRVANAGVVSGGAFVNLSTGQFGTIEAGVTASSIQDVGNGWYRVSVTGVLAGTASQWAVQVSTGNGNISYTGDGTSGILIWGAQLETGSTATAYQRVVSQYDVTESGKQTLHYVQYDGSDDGYVTPTITPGIDKVQVFAGVRKLSDAAIGMVVEHSANINTNAGAFRLTAPATVGPSYSFGSRGDGAVVADALISSGFAAPVTNVITGIGDISGDVSRFRANGTQVASSTQDQGTGNFLAYPLYIGRRGGTTLPFNGRDYGIITRFGANLDASTIAATESWLNQKTGAY